MTRASRYICIAAAGVVLLALPGVASARDATSAEVRDLAERAITDGAAYDRLRSITSVDGRPVDLGRALDTNNVDDRAARLKALAGGGRVDVDSSKARREARDILSERRFDPAGVPRPFRGILERIGDAIRRVVQPVIDVLPGGDATFWTIVGASVVAIVMLVAAYLAQRRRLVALPRRYERYGDAHDLDPAQLEHLADEAEARGDLASAIRLRFHSGLLKLDSAGVVDFHPSLTAGEARRRLRLASFDGVVSTYERVAYGGREPSESDVAQTKRGWARVLEEAVR